MKTTAIRASENSILINAAFEARLDTAVRDSSWTVRGTQSQSQGNLRISCSVSTWVASLPLCFPYSSPSPYPLSRYVSSCMTLPITLEQRINVLQELCNESYCEKQPSSIMIFSMYPSSAASYRDGNWYRCLYVILYWFPYWSLINFPCGKTASRARCRPSAARSGTLHVVIHNGWNEKTFVQYLFSFRISSSK